MPGGQDRQVVDDRDDVVFVDDIPLGATGKIDKKFIRERIEALCCRQPQGGRLGPGRHATQDLCAGNLPGGGGPADAQRPFPVEAAPGDTEEPTLIGPEPAPGPSRAQGRAEAPLWAIVLALVPGVLVVAGEVLRTPAGGVAAFAATWAPGSRCSAS